ncbi:hypothetical protein [Poritiphilus flavus]|uniref:DUF3575 domain-containing protein n=1 Tax=Poritiphilus flavus TaxID=2697053 RepID=A0A6L9EDA2_9FLAO|nr:hypothetical protein [Poritiphilus flavus]NAS12538.1 hypothetical protein [Poritiphilus flavus]
MSVSMVGLWAQNNMADLGKNHISLDPIQPFFGTAQIQYERPILKRVSLSLSMGYKFSSGIFDVANTTFERFETDEFNLTGIKLIPEIRWYTQKSHPGLTGFYVGTYFRYQDRSGNISGNYTSLERQVSRILIEADLDTSNIGIEIGYKLELKNGFFLDFIIAGPGLSFNNLELREIEPVPEAFYNDLNETLRDLGIIDLLDPDFRINGNQRTYFPMLAFRYGFKIGFAF